MVIYKGGFEPSFRSITRPNVISINSWQVGAVPPFEYGKKLKKEGSADQDKPPVQLLVGSPCKERPMALLLSLTLQGIKRLCKLQKGVCQLRALVGHIFEWSARGVVNPAVCANLQLYNSILALHELVTLFSIPEHSFPAFPRLATHIQDITHSIYLFCAKPFAPLHGLSQVCQMGWVMTSHVLRD